VRRVLLIAAVAAALGLGTFAWMVMNAVSVEPAGPAEARARLAEVRGAMGDRQPLLRVETTGALVRHATVPPEGAVPTSHLSVLAYRAASAQLARGDIPFWFVRLKGPALEWALRDTGVDLERLGLAVEDLEAHGPGLILDETRANGDRLLIWTR
jgi:hypothetical protein